MLTIFLEKHTENEPKTRVRLDLVQQDIEVSGKSNLQSYIRHIDGCKPS